MQITQLGSDGYHIHHTAANNRNLAASGFSGVNHLLNTVHVGSKGCHNNTLFSLAEDIFQYDADILLRRREGLASLRSCCRT